jgi:D-alanyl-D-alanine carboxypeptidase
VVRRRKRKKRSKWLPAAIIALLAAAILLTINLVDTSKIGNTVKGWREIVQATPGNEVSGSGSVSGSDSVTEGDGGQKETPERTDSPSLTPGKEPVVSPLPEPTDGAGAASPSSDGDQPVSSSPDKGTQPTAKPSTGQGQAGGGDAGMAVIAKPESITALVNKQNKLPEDYNPADLVYPDVRFTFTEKSDKRKLRKEAATALEKLFAGAEKDDIYLAGVSAYRSHSTQKSLFERYVKRDGLEKARTYSAYPGTSEHETGLAIDVSGSDGKCAAADCFGNTKEAKWLAEHAHEYGFIIRYPKGKEDITGYQYEPWHLRYVGVDIAGDIHESGETLEEYLDEVPVKG